MRASNSLLAAVCSCSCICGSLAQLQQAVPDVHSTSRIDRAMSIAIIGAGAAGSSAAYYLSQYAHNDSIPLNITIFERNSYVGGRSTTVNAYDDPNYPVELGASIFVKVNQILVEAAQTFNLTTSSTSSVSHLDTPSLGIWDGKQFVVTMSSSGPTWWDTTKILWKYGLAPIRTMRLMKSTVGRFLSMYEAPIFPFHTLTRAADDADLLGVTSSSGIQYLLENGVSAAFAHDVIQASTRVNYAQNLERFHGLETMVCMATEGAMAIDGGNWQIFENMIISSKATLQLSTKVSSIERAKNGRYTIQSRTVEDEDILNPSADFDAVIIAAPYQYTDIEMSNLHTPEAVEYVHLHVTLFTSPRLPSPELFGLDSTASVPSTILTTTQCDGQPETCFNVDGTAPDFYSISLLMELENPSTGRLEYAYKIFSHSPIKDIWLARLLDVQDDDVQSQITWIERKVWHSYPLEIPRRSFEQIELERNLWYTAGMDNFISTMETNALMGKNVAKLIIDRRIQDNKHLHAHIDTQDAIQS